MAGFRCWLKLVEDAGRGLGQFAKDGKVEMFHFSPARFPPGTVVTLDPNKFGGNSYTRNDVNAASTPRVFFYLDVNEKEHIVSGRLYKAVVPADQIYNILDDPLGIKKRLRADLRVIEEMPEQNREAALALAERMYSERLTEIIRR